MQSYSGIISLHLEDRLNLYTILYDCNITFANGSAVNTTQHEGSTWVQTIYAMSHITFYFFPMSPCHFL